METEVLRKAMDVAEKVLIERSMHTRLALLISTALIGYSIGFLIATTMSVYIPWLHGLYADLIEIAIGVLSIVAMGIAMAIALRIPRVRDLLAFSAPLIKSYRFLVPFLAMNMLYIVGEAISATFMRSIGLEPASPYFAIPLLTKYLYIKNFSYFYTLWSMLMLCLSTTIYLYSRSIEWSLGKVIAIAVPIALGIGCTVPREASLLWIQVASVQIFALALLQSFGMGLHILGSEIDKRDLVKALLHPTRLAILLVLIATDRVLTLADLEKILGIPRQTL